MIADAGINEDRAAPGLDHNAKKGHYKKTVLLIHIGRISCHFARRKGLLGSIGEYKVRFTEGTFQFQNSMYVERSRQ